MNPSGFVVAVAFVFTCAYSAVRLSMFEENAHECYVY